MSTAVEIRIVRDDPDSNDYTTIETTKDGEIEAILAAATVLLFPYGRLLTTRRAALNHLLDRLLEVSGEPDHG